MPARGTTAGGLRRASERHRRGPAGQRFFQQATAEIESSIAEVEDLKFRISTYLAGVGAVMSRCSPEFYTEMADLLLDGLSTPADQGRRG